MESEGKEYPKFVASMRKTHTILIPSMLPFHMALFEKALLASGYKVEIMKNEGADVVTEGLKYVHNDTCYPALLVIGQFIDNLNHRTDHDKLVLLITQTGGGCRASNYIHLLRKALDKAGYGFIPVVSLNASNLEKDSGLKLTYDLIKKIAAAMTYGDEIMYLYNKTRSYETEPGSAKKLALSWVEKIGRLYERKKGVSYSALKKNLRKIAKSFDALSLDLSHALPKVGVVGEIYVKYAALGNNHLEEFLVSERAEVMVPGLYGFILYCLYNSIYDSEFYGHGKIKKLGAKFIIWYLRRREKLMINSMKHTKFTPMKYFSHTKDLSEGILSHGTKMGEGWLLTAEMMELVEIGYDNIICTQPFGCLPNHICGKGVMKKIKSLHPDANIVAIDYDPSATKVNQENRIKLMLAIAREKIKENEDAKL
ncbi:MAG: 2-hydroxyglutaryl-CoA dehydratase [Acholeplasmatales bacterium]|jgi:predicted nucleotide-binding protein (sugar kinase/HSP70/actin superfamily)|nr:2-hydroxyglutaryl-CoA dehydratase [Acholeplasmatales bacterium]MCI9654295.1 2-hydroxyglutaryl-CoA dehydratase [Acholeplasmatales bacterium]